MDSIGVHLEESQGEESAAKVSEPEVPEPETSESKAPEELHAKIMKEKDLNTLRNWLKLAAKADSIEQFMREME